MLGAAPGRLAWHQHRLAAQPGVIDQLRPISAWREYRIDSPTLGLCLLHVDELEPKQIPGPGLRELPELAAWHGIWDDEPTQSDTVVQQYDRCVAGNVDATDRVTDVDRVRRIGACFARLVRGYRRIIELRAFNTKSNAIAAAGEPPLGRTEPLMAGSGNPIVVRPGNHPDQVLLLIPDRRPDRLRSNLAGGCAAGW